MEAVRTQETYSRFGIGTFVATMLVATCCFAQYPSGANNGMAGNGTVPMAPSTPVAPGDFTRPIVPGPPQQTPISSRPSAWPGAAANQPSPTASPDFRSQFSPGPATTPAAAMTPCVGSRIVARVGSEVILESELILRSMRDLKVEGSVNYLLEQSKNQLSAEELEMRRMELLREILPSMIQTKLIYLDAKRAIPAEGWSQVERHINTVFDEVVLEKLLKREGVTTSRELDEKLRKIGSSLEREKRAFFEFEVARQYMQQQSKKDDEITYDQMLHYYHTHLKEFTTPNRARWEELMVSFSRFPNKAAAYDAIAQLGNQVFTGVPFGQVAKASSHGFTATDGGQRKWTDQGSLVSKELDQALFSLPVGQLSPIIESQNGFHIIRVTEREPLKVAAFLDAQVEIRDKIVDERTTKQRTEYFKKVQAKTPVWTIFDGDVQRLNMAGRQQPVRR